MGLTLPPTTATPTLSPEEARGALTAVRREQAQRGQLPLIGFTRHTFGPKPSWHENWHHGVSADFFDAFADGRIRRAIYCAPPRHTKSEFVSRRLPAKLFGDDPELHVLHTCHTARLGHRMSRDIKRVMRSPRYAELYPDTFLADSPKARALGGRYLNTDEAWEIPGHDGRYRAAGVGQAIAGEGADVLFIDDPVKGRKQAYSALERENTWEWYLNDAYSRLQSDDSRILITATRWHDDDLVGRILEQAKHTGEKWEVLTLRAEREVGDPDGWWWTKRRDPRKVGDLLWPTRFGPKRVDVVKRHPAVWAALFQQNPIPETGHIFQSQWFRRWTEWPPLSARVEALISWDLAFKATDDSSYVVGQLWVRLGRTYFLLDQVRGRWEFPETCKVMLAFHARYPFVRRFLVEDKANGPAVISSFARQGIYLEPILPKGSKAERAHAITPVLAAGAAYYPPDERAPWMPAFVREHTRFKGLDGDVSDQVDAHTQAIGYWELGQASPYWGG